MLLLPFCSELYCYICLWLIVFGIFPSDATTATPSCGASSASKHIALLQPSNPPRICSYHINAYNKNVCQLRIDFSMTLAQPSIPNDQNGLWYVQCMKDYLEVNRLKFCGSETAQHIYLPYNQTAGIDLNFVLVARKGSNRNLPKPQWNMMVTQLECGLDVAQEQRLLVDEQVLNPLWAISLSLSTEDNLLVAPPGCLQYFPEITGTIISFNYAGGSGVYTGNLNYAICIRRPQETQLLKLKVHYFNLGSEHSRQKFHELDNYCRPQLHTEGLSEDYLLIPQAIVEDSNIRATYFCGNSIQGDTVLSTNPGPLILIFNSDGNYKTEKEVGFALSYNIV